MHKSGMRKGSSKGETNALQDAHSEGCKRRAGSAGHFVIVRHVGRLVAGRSRFIRRAPNKVRLQGVTWKLWLTGVASR